MKGTLRGMADEPQVETGRDQGLAEEQAPARQPVVQYGSVEQLLDAFDVRINVDAHWDDQSRRWLPLLLADERFALAFDERPEASGGLVWVPAPAVRAPVAKTLS